MSAISSSERYDGTRGYSIGKADNSFGDEFQGAESAGQVTTKAPQPKFALTLRSGSWISPALRAILLGTWAKPHKAAKCESLDFSRRG